MVTKERTTSFNFRIPISDLEKLEEYAKKVGQPPNVLIQLIIKGLLLGAFK